MNKYELAKKITQLDGLTNEEKASLVELLRSQKKYGLVWEDKPEEIETRLVDELPVLTEVPERAIVSDSPDAPNHILIEGDNLEALTALAYTHEGKIDVIYIDPPYNTGNKDFVYNDSFVDREDGYRHSKWLSFMNKRLQIAKSLLSSGGVIFISIDDNEQAQLKLLCDEVFGINNFIGNIVWFKKRKGSFLSNTLVSLTEYVLAYSNSSDIKLFGGLPNNTESQPIIKRTNSKKILSFEGNIVKSKLKDGIYKAGLYGKGTSSSLLLNDIEIKNGYIITPFKIEAPFVWSQEFMENELANGTEFVINTINFQVRVIRHNSSSIKALSSFIDGREISATNEDAYELLKNIFKVDNPFQYSKPVNLIVKLILSNSFNNKNISILDFFAGSGTTLHATMQLNAEDGGHRKCILVTNNENNICEEVTYERNKRVIQGYTTPKGEEVEGLHDNNLRYYRTTLLSRDKSVKDMRQLVRLATDMLCIKNDVYTEAEFCGKKINPNIARYFDNGQGNRMLVIYEERAIQLLVQLMAQTEDDGIKTMVYVFSPGADPYTDDFEDVAERVKLCALPSAIYEAYKRVLPKRKPKFLDEALQEMKTQAEAEANMQQTLDFGENDNMNEEGGEA